MDFKDMPQELWKELQQCIIEHRRTYNELRAKLENADFDYSVFDTEDVEKLYKLMSYHYDIAQHQLNYIVPANSQDDGDDDENDD